MEVAILGVTVVANIGSSGLIDEQPGYEATSQAPWTTHLQSGCGKWLTLEAPCGLTTFPEITVDDSPGPEVEVDVDISLAPESAVIRVY